MAINDIAVQEFVNAIKEEPRDTNTTYNAVVSRIDSEGVVWVNLQGSEIETPTVSASSEVEAGDSVTVQWRNNKLYIEGNYSNPSAGTATVTPTVNFVTELLEKDISANSISATTGYIGELTARNITAEDITADHATIDSLDANYAHITDGVIDNAKIGYADVEDLDANYAHIADGVIDNAKIDYADVNDLSTNYAQINLANVNNAWIENGVVKEAAISDAQIIGVSANKLTAGTIDASNITVTNLNASNITAGSITVDGITIDVENNEASIDGGYIEDGTITLEGFAQEVKDVIDGAIETFTGTVVPTLNNTPASSWTTTKLKDQHIGDVYYVVNSSSQQNGYCYRFTKSGSTYSWQLIKDSDVTAALQRLQTAEGKISNIESFDEEMATFKTETEGEISTLQTKTTSLETSLGDKVDKSTFNEVKQTVDGNSASITELSTITTNNGLTKTTNITNTVNTVSQTATGNSSKISSLTNTLGTNADGTTKAGDIVHRTSAVEQDLSGFKTTVSKTYHKTSDFNTYKAANDTAVAAAKKAGDDAQADLDEYKGTVSETYATKSSLTQTAEGIRTDVSSTYETKTDASAKLTEAKGDASTKANKALTDAKADTTNKLKSYYTKTETDSAITQKAGEISLSVAQTEISKIEVGGRNLLRRTKTYEGWEKASSITLTQDEEGITVANWPQVSTASWRDIRSSGGEELLIPYSLVRDREVTLSCWFKMDAIPTSDINGILYVIFDLKDAGTYTGNRKKYTANVFYGKIEQTTDWQRVVWTGTISDALFASGTGTIADTDLFYTQIYNHNLPATHVKKVKLEYGNRVTDWTPAPEDVEAYTDTQVSAAKAEIKVTTDGISTKVEKKTDKSTIISTIRQSAETVKIKASQVEIDGTATFNAIKSSADAAYDVKGAAQSAVDGIEVGGRNMLVDSDAPTLTKVYAPANRYFMSSNRDGAGSIDVGSDMPLNGLKNVVKFNIPADKNGTNYALVFYSNNQLSVIEGQEYTLSYYARIISGAAKAWLQMGSSPYVMWRAESNLTSSWKQYSHTFTYTDASMAGSGTTREYFGATSASDSACVVELCGFKMEKGNKATDWSPAPEDVQAEIDAVDTKADGANSQEQRIYYRSNSTSAPTAPSTWVVSEETTNATWSTKRMQYDSTYKYLYTCIQRKTVGGAITNSTVLLDDTTTVIDGGNIITGTVTANQIKTGTITSDHISTDKIDANKIKVEDIQIKAAQIKSGTIDDARIPNLDAGKITTGTINIGRVPNDALNSNIEVGGRNLLLNSSNMPLVSSGVGGYRASGGTASHITITNPPISGISGGIRITNSGTSAARIGLVQDRRYNTFVAGEKYSQSFWIRASTSFTSTVDAQMIWRTSGQKAGPVSKSMTLTTSWQYVKGEGATLQGTQADYYSAGYVYASDVPAGAYIEVCADKVEKGTKATDWTPAPEDVQSGIDAARTTATNYIYADSSGIKIASADPSTQKQRMQLTSSEAALYSSDDIKRVSITSGTGVVVGNASKGHATVNDSGLLIYDTNNKKRTSVTSSGLDVFDTDGSTNVAKFGDTVRIGKESGSHLTLSPDSMSMSTGTKDVFNLLQKTMYIYWTRNYKGRQFANSTDRHVDSWETNTTISTWDSITVNYKLNNTSRTKKITSISNGVLANDEIYVHFNYSGTKITLTYGRGSSAASSDIIKLESAVVYYVTDEKLSQLHTGTYPNTTVSGALRIGNGTSDSNRINLMLVDWSGTGKFKGDILAFCGADSSGGMSLTKAEENIDAFKYKDANGYVYINAYRVGRIVSLLCTVSKTPSTAVGANLYQLNLTNAHLPKPLGTNTSGTGIYSSNMIIGNIYYNRTVTPNRYEFICRNGGSTAVSTVSVGFTITYICQMDEVSGEIKYMDD